MALRKITEMTEGNRTVKVHKDGDTKEYRARLYVNGKADEPADYFTNCEEDATKTAMMMVRPGAMRDRFPAGYDAESDQLRETVQTIRSRNQREGKYKGRTGGKHCHSDDIFFGAVPYANRKQRKAVKRAYGL